MQMQTQNNNNHDPNKHEFYLTCERYYIFELLTFAAGMMGLYTLNLRGGVFCNAQTGNIALMALEFGKGNFKESGYYLIPFLAYVGGTITSEIMPKTIVNIFKIRWDTFLTGFEFLVLFLVGFIPLTWPDAITQIIINFICSMQFNTFRQAEKLTMATTFLTAHVRQFGVHLVHFLQNRDRETGEKLRRHFQIIIIFFGGGALVTFAGSVLTKPERSIWIALIPLSICFALMLYSDLVTEKTRLQQKPRGH